MLASIPSEYLSISKVADYKTGINFSKNTTAKQKWQTAYVKSYDYNEIQYLEVFEVPDYKTDVSFQENKMLDLKCRTI